MTRPFSDLVREMRHKNPIGFAKRQAVAKMEALKEYGEYTCTCSHTRVGHAGTAHKKGECLTKGCKCKKYNAKPLPKD
jgi:hypothetical protein